MRSRFITALASCALFASACSAASTSAVNNGNVEQATSQPASSAAPFPDENPTVAAAEPTTTAPPPTSTPEPEATAAPTSEPVSEQPLFPGMDPVTLLTPPTDVSVRPLLEWEPVADALYYSVVVYGPDGDPYWGTLTDESETFLGGPERIDEDKPGPRLIDDMSWSVLALDENLFPVAGSGLRPISP